MSFILPFPPNPDDLQYAGNPLALARAMYDWSIQSKSNLEQSQPISNGIPIAGPKVGDMPYKAPLAWARLAAGSSGQVMTWGTASAPVWSNSAAASITSGSGIAITGAGTSIISLTNIAPKNILANLGTSSAAPTGNSFSAVIDSAIASIQGDTLYRGTSTWSALAPGSNGQFLQTQGTNANPLWSWSSYEIDVLNYGAIPDCRRLTDVVATTTSSNITSATGAFTAADTGKLINLYDFTNSNYVFRGTFTFATSTSGSLSGTPGNALLAANCIGYIGTDNSTAFKNALAAADINIQPKDQGPNLALGGGNQAVVFPSTASGNMYAFGSQIVVPTNIILDADAMLVPMVSTAATNTQGNANRIFPLILMPGASINRLQMFCNYTMGICLGIYTQQSHTDIFSLTLWDVGNNNQSGSLATTANVNTAGSGYAVNDTITLTGGTGTKAVITVYSVNGSGGVTSAYVSNGGNYSVLPTNPVSQGSTSGSGISAKFNLTFAPNSHIGLEVSGNDTFIDKYWVKNANIGIDLDQANDVMINHLFLIGCGTALKAVGCEEVQIGIIQIDTGSFAGISIDSSHTFRINGGHVFSLNSTSLTYGLGIGQNDASNPCRNIDLTYSFYRCGGDAMRIGNLADSRIKANITNAPLYGAGGVDITNAINFTGAASPTGNLFIDAVVGTVGTTITPITGTIYGAVYINGQLRPVALTSGTNISWNLYTAPYATLTLSTNGTLGNPSPFNTGRYPLIVTQDATGNRTLAYGTAYKWASGSAPVLSTAANKKDIIQFLSDGTNMYGIDINKNY